MDKKRQIKMNRVCMRMIVIITKENERKEKIQFESRKTEVHIVSLIYSLFSFNAFVYCFSFF